MHDKTGASRQTHDTHLSFVTSSSYRFNVNAPNLHVTFGYDVDCDSFTLSSLDAATLKKKLRNLFRIFLFEEFFFFCQYLRHFHSIGQQTLSDK